MQLKEPIRIKQFVNKWNRECSEQQEARDYWAELIEILLGVDHGRDHCEWEKPVKLIVDKNGKSSTSTKSIDVYLQPSRHYIGQVLIHRQGRELFPSYKKYKICYLC